MKILITSDFHIGVRSDSNTYYNIYNNWIDNFLIPQIQLNNVEQLVITGDIFDSRNEINVHTENIALDSVDKILNLCLNLEIKIICGNHDLYLKSSRKIHSLKKFKKFKRTEVIDTIQLRKVGNKMITYCPWLISNKELEDFVGSNGKSDFCFGHFPINGFSMIKGVVEKSSWSQQFFKDNFLKVFSGHFHLRDEQSNITFVGNPFQMDWGDYGDNKGIYILDTDTLQTKFIENDISPRYVKIFLSQLKNKTADINSAAGNFVQLILDSEFTDKILEKLYLVIESKNPLSFKVEGEEQKVELNIDDIQERVSNPIEYLIGYINELVIPSDVDKERLIKEVYEIYNKSLI